MFDRLLTHLSLRRACAGIYSELRTIRQLMEIRWEADGLELPRHRKQRAAAEGDDGETEGTIAVEPELTIEQLAAAEARRVQVALLEGKNPGTAWRPDPNR